jgi:hypothetical protein
VGVRLLGRAPTPTGRRKVFSEHMHRAIEITGKALRLQAIFSRVDAC